MQGQALDHNEIMSIRWAHDDPNPVAQDSISRADRDALTGLLNAKGISTTAAPYEYPADYQVPDAKRLRLENGADVATDHPDIAYPNTDTQYTSQSSAAALAAQYGMTQEQYAAYCEAYYANQYGIATDGSTDSVIGTSTQQEHAIESSSSGTSASEVAGAGVLSSYLTDLLKPSETSLSSESSKKTEQDGSSSKDILLSGWTEYIDDDTGATYYYHAESGESSWEVPTV